MVTKKPFLLFFVFFTLLSVQFTQTYVAADGGNRDDLYTYHDTYASLVADMQNLNNEYPNIFELYTAQDAFGLPDVTSGSETYKTWIIRITNESSGFNKPEVLFIGGHHGDEPVGVEAPYYLAEWLAQHYDNDPFIHYLVDHREIYIMPVVNPYGWVHSTRYDENGIDMNRDYPYDPSDHIFATIGARAVHELTKRHLFINTISWHSGTEMIIYAWGCYAHTGNTECPDDKAFYNEGKYMSQYGGPYNGYYQWGRANDILYPCYGAYEDYAYAMSWDTPNADPNWPTEGCRSLTHCIEISDIKAPPESTLGGRADVYIPGGEEEGYIPKNIRIALLMTDIAEPYIKITSDIPHMASAGQHVSITWEVRGALSTTETNIQYGSDPDPVHNYQWSTTTQSGGTAWQNTNYTQEIVMPTTPGIYYFVVRAKVDQDTLNQNNPDPDAGPQSLWVKMRTDDSWSISNNGNTLEGQTNWYSMVFTIPVGEDDVPPSTSLTVDGTVGNDGWYTGFTVVRLSASDDLSGVNYTMYNVNGEGWQVYSDPFLVDEGVVNVEYYSVDFAGNVEDVNSFTFKYDGSDPVTSCVLEGDMGLSGWYRGDVTVSLTASDVVSGVDVTWYRLDGEDEWHHYTGSFVVSDEGHHVLEFYSVDVAGNREDTSTRGFYIDNSPPSVSLLYPLGGETLSGTVVVRWNSSDVLSDTLVSLDWSIDGLVWYPLVSDVVDNGSFLWDTTGLFDGNYSLRVTVSDFAGNSASDVSDVFSVSNGVSPPAVDVVFVKPEPGGLYLFGNRFLSLPGSLTVAVGDLDVQVDASVESSVVYVDHVEFYLDGVLQSTVSSEPYVWHWGGLVFGKHTVRVVAVDILGGSGVSELVVWRFL